MLHATLAAAQSQLEEPPEDGHLGTLQEYRFAKERIDGLRVPYLVTIGNHDLLGKGGAIFDRMFGARDATFVHRGVRFVLLDTNSREHGFGAGVPRLDWLAGELSAKDAAPGAISPQGTIVFAHVPPSSADFDPDLGSSYLALLRDSGVIGAFYGHEHRFHDSAHEGVPYRIVEGRRGGARAGFFYELVALDHVLVAWWRNRGSLSLADAFSLAIGTSVEF